MYAVSASDRLRTLPAIWFPRLYFICSPTKSRLKSQSAFGVPFLRLALCPSAMGTTVPSSRCQKTGCLPPAYAQFSSSPHGASLLSQALGAVKRAGCPWAALSFSESLQPAARICSGPPSLVGGVGHDSGTIRVGMRLCASLTVRFGARRLPSHHPALAIGCQAVGLSGTPLSLTASY